MLNAVWLLCQAFFHVTVWTIHYYTQSTGLHQDCWNLGPFRKERSGKTNQSIAYIGCNAFMPKHAQYHPNLGNQQQFLGHKRKVALISSKQPTGLLPNKSKHHLDFPLTTARCACQNSYTPVGFYPDNVYIYKLYICPVFQLQSVHILRSLRIDRIHSVEYGCGLWQIALQLGTAWLKNEHP